MEYDMMLDELSRKKEGNEDLTRQVEVLNDKLTCANADLKADIDRWHKNKRRDFRKLFMNMADRQICYLQKCLEAWEEAIPKIQRTDIDVADELAETSSQKLTLKDTLKSS
jgi:sorting nexin-7/30